MIKSGDIIVYGGAMIVSSLIKEQLIDEFHLFVNPVILGKGMSIFRTIKNIQNFGLRYSQSFDCEIALFCYIPKQNQLNSEVQSSHE